ncbi:putative bifunctional diguanylate cyclase/phosphodiesterase [Acidithiobacillus sp. IBUN Pt1247-S3]|uniref:putative bifunctional diguanylate cyclase/phosphodiesterase n=1 Tax=Acidithiobacillus sp. IBUN Pt1247-S3 TaxID=3166642 RepID=UPI0034E3B1BE
MTTTKSVEDPELLGWVAFSPEEELWLRNHAANLCEQVNVYLAAHNVDISTFSQEEDKIFHPWLSEWLRTIVSGVYDARFWEQQIQVGERLALLSISIIRWAQIFSWIREETQSQLLALASCSAQSSLGRHFSALLDGCQYVIQTGYLQQQSHDLLARIRNLTRIFQLEAFFHAAAELAYEFAQAQGAGLIILEGERLRYRLFHGQSTRFEKFSQFSFPKEEGIAGLALRENRAIFERDYPHSPYALQEFVEAGLQGSLAFPLSDPGGVQGVLVLSWFRDSPPVRIPELAWEHLRLLVDLLAALLFRQTLEHKLQNLSTRDFLTGLPNQRVIIDRIHAAMARSVRHQQLFALLFLDLDGFKKINDECGHLQGDAVLQQVAERLRSALRIQDTAIRYAGDEFVLLVEDIAHVSEVDRVAERILGAARFQVEGQYSVSASLGVVIYPFDEGSPEKLLHHADQAMYVAKERGGDGWVPFGHYLQDAVQEEQELLHDLSIALAQKEFLLHWQPIISLPSKQIVGAEALLRWQHPKRGLLAPEAFLEVLERSSLMGGAGQWIVETAITQAERWHQAGQELDIHINLSGRELRNPRWIPWCKVLLNRFPGVHRKHLQFEIVERVAVEELPVVAKQIREAKKQLGVQFVLDDFGTGASALQHLGELDCCGIKIDQSMIRDLQTNTKHRHLVRGLLYLARSLSVDVVAEGVENEQVAQILTEIGVEKIQGYWFSRPLPVDDMDAILDTDTKDRRIALQARIKAVE